MRVFKDIGLVEQLGSGMERILKGYDKSIFKFFDHIIKVNFPVESSSISSSVILNKTQITILSLVKQNALIKQKEIASQLGISDRAIRKAMVPLIKNNIVKREGTNRKGKWIVISDYLE